MTNLSKGKRQMVSLFLCCTYWFLAETTSFKCFRGIFNEFTIYYSGFIIQLISLK